MQRAVNLDGERVDEQLGRELAEHVSRSGGDRGTEVAAAQRRFARAYRAASAACLCAPAWYLRGQRR